MSTTLEGNVGAFVLRGAQLVDGTGSPSRRADVRVDGDRITAVGDVAREPDVAEVDLTGLTLAPGFIDIHTHYDAQILWDGGLSPSCWHGVTSVVMGNCGFGVAPASPDNRELVLGILEMVEDMAPEALRAGVSWEFETFPEYLDVIERRPKRVNVAAFVGHTPLRVAAMGADASERAATERELAHMCALVQEARQAGAIGLASSLAPNHLGPGGKPAPSIVGGIDELTRLIAAMGTGVVEVSRGRFPVEGLEACAREGITLSWSSLLTGRPGEANSVFDLVDKTAALSGTVWPQMSCRPLTIRVALDNPVALGTLPALNEILSLAPNLREARYRDHDWRERFRANIDETWAAILRRAVALAGGVADPQHGLSVAEYAAAHELPISDAFVDLALEHGLDTRFDIPVANLDEGDIARLLQDRRTIIGLSDAGAHANQQCDASFATYLLGHWCRELEAIPLELAVWRLTGQPASVYRIPDRGIVNAGAIADLVAFDPQTVSALPLEQVNDLPAGATRLVSRSTGIDSIWVAGQPTRRHEVDLDAMPGRLLRGA
jgi:N-acyl-D-aspartate/D-glutamate deacylase